MGNLVTEDGIVMRVADGVTVVKTIKKATCEGCASKDSCEAAKEAEVEAINAVNAQVGDSVVVGFESGSLIKVTMMLYLFPVFSMIVGAMLGSFLAPQYGFRESDLAAILSFSLFFLSFGCIRLASGSLSRNEKYRARIVRIRKRAASPSPSSNCVGRVSEA